MTVFIREEKEKLTLEAFDGMERLAGLDGCMYNVPMIRLLTNYSRTGRGGGLLIFCIGARQGWKSGYPGNRAIYRNLHRPNLSLHISKLNSSLCFFFSFLFSTSPLPRPPLLHALSLYQRDIHICMSNSTKKKNLSSTSSHASKESRKQSGFIPFLALLLYHTWFFPAQAE